MQNFWNADIAEHVLSYRIKMLVGKEDFYRFDVVQQILRKQTGNIRLAKEIFCQNHSGVSRGKWDKLLWKLRQFGINPLTFSDTAEDLPNVLKNPCSLLAEDFQRSK